MGGEYFPGSGYGIEFSKGTDNILLQNFVSQLEKEYRMMSEKVKILFIDDYQPHIDGLVKACMKIFGENGEIGFLNPRDSEYRFYAFSGYDIIFLDKDMGFVDGQEILDHLKKYEGFDGNVIANTSKRWTDQRLSGRFTRKASFDYHDEHDCRHLEAFLEKHL